MVLKDVDVKIFGIFVNWLYTQKLSHEGLNPADISLNELGELSMLGDIWCIPKLQNKVMALIPGLFKEAILSESKSHMHRYLGDRKEKKLCKSCLMLTCFDMRRTYWYVPSYIPLSIMNLLYDTSWSLHYTRG